ncbi:hypothetical protein C0993_001430, partial [Termitomyces sp. T159_Od127]
MERVSGSPRSVSATSSPSGSPPKLSSDTLALLQEFLTSRAEEEKRFNDLAERAAARVASRDLDVDIEEPDPPMMSVDEYRLAFGEDWQLSQFWYSTSYATRLAKSIRSISFQHTNPLDGARLLEYDQRFSVLAPTKFIHYDLDEPDTFPENLRGAVDVVVADPPFLNE